MLKRVVDPVESGVSEIQSLPNGAVRIQCKTNEALNEIEKRVKEHDADNYTTKEKDSAYNGRVKIIGMTNKHDEQELSVRIQNLMENNTVKVLKMYSDKNTRIERYNAIVEMNVEVMDEIIKKGRINIDWDECKVHKYVYVKRCYKCLGFNHVAKTCVNKIACSKCAGEHNVRDCNAENMSCVNCIEHNKKNKANTNTCHHAFARECLVLQQTIEKLQNKNKHED